MRVFFVGKKLKKVNNQTHSTFFLLSPRGEVSGYEMMEDEKRMVKPWQGTLVAVDHACNDLP